MTTRGERLQRFKDNLISQSAGKSLAELGARLVAAQEALSKYLEGVTTAQAAYKPAPEEWCIAEVVGHAREASASMRKGLRRGLAGQSSEANPMAHGSCKPEDVLAVAQRERDDMASFLRSISGEANSERTITVNPFGQLNCKACLFMLAYHFGDHNQQVAKIKTSAGYPIG